LALLGSESHNYPEVSLTLLEIVWQTRAQNTKGRSSEENRPYMGWGLRPLGRERNLYKPLVDSRSPILGGLKGPTNDLRYVNVRV